MKEIKKSDYNDIEDRPLDVKKDQEFIYEKDIRQNILALTPEKARKFGIKHRSALAYLKKKSERRRFEF